MKKSSAIHDSGALLVYGGIDFSIRCQIGIWPKSSLPVLENKFGLPEAGWAFGMGILDGRSFLILRRRQIGTANREYPLSILLAPDAATWERFDWSAAAIIVSLLESRETLPRLLFENPEVITRVAFADLLKVLAFPIVPASKTSTASEVATLLAGTLFETEPVAISFPLKIPHPTPVDVAQAVIDLPILMKNGCGWLVGGNLSQARHLGVRLVFDPQMEMSDTKAEIISVNGQRLLEQWTKLERVSVLRSWFKKVSHLPVWKLEPECRNQMPGLSSTIEALAMLVESSELSDSEFIQIREGIMDNPELESGLSILVASKVPHRGSLSVATTMFVLDNVDRDIISPNQVSGEILDRETYIDWLITNEIFPSRSPISVHLTPEEVFKICSRLLLRGVTPASLPARLKELLSEFPDTSASVWPAKLAEQAFQKSGEDWYIVWKPFRTEPFFRKYLATLAETRARDDASEKKKGWEISYLLFSDDFSWQWAAFNLSKDTQLSFVSFLLATSRSKSAHSSEVTPYLSSLATSPVRSIIPIEEKKKIVQLGGRTTDAWLRLNSLLSVLEGKVYCAVQAKPTEVPFLLRELTDVLNSTTVRLSEVQRSGLEQILGSVPDEILPASSFPAEESSVDGEDEEGAGTHSAASERGSKDVTRGLPEHSLAVALHLVKTIADNIDELSLCMRSVLRNEVISLDDSKSFWNSTSEWRMVFPLLPLSLRVRLIQKLLSVDPGASDRLKLFIKNARAEKIQSFFEHSIWESFLTTSRGRALLGAYSSRADRLRVRGLFRRSFLMELPNGTTPTKTTTSFADRGSVRQTIVKVVRRIMNKFQYWFNNDSDEF